MRTVLVNGRISDRSYPRYRLVRRWFRRVLADVDRCCAQSDESARRLVDLGAPADRGGHDREPEVRRAGRRQAPAPRRRGDDFPRSLGLAPDRPVLMAASTHPGEEGLVLDAFRRLRSRVPGLVFVLAPRHPERGAEVAALAAARGLATGAPQPAARGRRGGGRRRRARYGGRAGRAVPRGHRRLRWGESGAGGRAQRDRAGGVGKAGGVRAAHGELRRDRRALSRPRGRPTGLGGRGAGAGAGRVAGGPAATRRAGGPPPGPWWRANRGAAVRSLAEIAAVLPPGRPALAGAPGEGSC